MLHAPPLPTHTLELDEDSISHVLGIIYPRLESQLMLAKNVQLIEALQEVKIHEEDTSFLSPQCQYILGKDDQPNIILFEYILLEYLYPFFLFSTDNAQQMTKDLKQQPSLIERLYGKQLGTFMRIIP